MKSKIVAVRLRNYKAFQDTGWIEFKPFTMLLGYNSNGKSTILKSLYLIKKCYEKYRSGVEYPPFSVGNEEDGGFNDFAYKGKTENVKNIEFSFRIDCKDEEILYSMEELCGIEAEKCNTFEYSVSARRNLKKNDVYIDSIQLKFAEKVFYECMYKENGDFAVATELLKNNNEKCELPMLYEVKNTFFLSNLSDVRYPSWVTDEEYSDRVGPEQRFVLQFMQGTLIGMVNQALMEFADNLDYIMPIRTLPKRYMNLMATNNNDVGINGNNTYNILFQVEAYGDTETKENIQKWLRLFGYEYKWRIIKPNYGEFILHDIKKGFDINIVDIGFGISQILPIIVASVQRKEGLLAIDSPEAHLHSSVQSEIADMFIDSMQEKCVFLETHSENIVMRVQRRVAEKKISNTDVALYFIENNEDGVYCRELKLAVDGSVIDPIEEYKQFFSAAYNDAFATMLLKGTEN